MITPREVEEKSMNGEKRKSARNDLFAFYVGRPLSYALTVPFLYTNLTPNSISILSVIPLIIGFLLMGLGENLIVLLIGWFCFFLWNVLDGVDGNLARYKNEFSRLGSVYDAMSGYAAMMLIFFACGWAASNQPGWLLNSLSIQGGIYVVLGALSGAFQIFPRLIMHKAITSTNDEESLSDVKDRSEYGFAKVVALNLTSATGFVQVFMLIAIIFNLLGLFTVVYFLVNLAVMLVSLRSIFKDST